MSVSRALRRAALAGTLAALATTVRADYQGCVAEEALTAGDEARVGALREECARQNPRSSNRLDARFALERQNRDNPFALTTHRPNYMMPVTWVRLPSRAGDPDRDSIEMQFQLSVKVPLAEGVLFGHGQLAGAYTNRSYWQAYGNNTSAPFRETNHEPELLLNFDNDWRPFGFRNVNQLILNHQSNGRDGDASRSWNRVMLGMIFERGNLAFTLRPWYRIPEPARDDDNPDIADYIGRMEVIAGWAHGEHRYGVALRSNLESDNRGAVELSWRFPIHRQIKLVLRYFNGYGESLINYDRWSESVGLGFLVSDWL